MHRLIATRAVQATVLLLIAVVFVGVGLALRAELSGSGRPPVLTAAAGAPSGHDLQALSRISHAGLPKYSSVIATVAGGTVELYRAPSQQPYRRLGSLAHSYGAPLVFLVDQHKRRAGWLYVILPVRPNGGRAWIRASRVRLSFTTYRIRVSLHQRRIVVRRGTRVVLSAPVGVGRAVSATPAGRYYLAYLLRPPNSHSVFGAYAFGLSAYSDVYSSFAGGDGEIGLHGTDDPAGLGHLVSHGCIRLSNSDITRLAHLLPLGTPITIAH